jgi:tetratricopeptide (TPR) repeat protein
VVAAAVALAAGLVEAESLQDLETRLEQVQRRYDTEAAVGVLNDVRAARRSGEIRGDDAVGLHVRAALAAAELLRIEYEGTTEAEAAERRTLGQRIDVAADEGLDLVDDLPETSERERLRADLVATKIRSDYRAQKYEDDFSAAVARALELDPDNPRALVSAAKRALFAPPEHGGDPAEAVRLLDRALELDPDLESARLLRALAHEDLGETEAAAADWRRVLESNPDATPAREGLDRIGGA